MPNIDIGMMLYHPLSLNIGIFSITPHLFEGLGLLAPDIPVKVIILPCEEHQPSERYNSTGNYNTFLFFLIANP